MRKPTMIVVAALLVALTGGGAAATPEIPDRSLLSAQATSVAELRAQVDLQLRLYPGGKKIGDNEVSYDGGRFVITFARPGARLPASPNCPSGWFCFYDGNSYTYPRGKLSSCGWQDLATYGWHDRTQSVHNNSDFWVEYIGHYDGGNPSSGHQFDERQLFWSARYSANPTVARPNQADHVFKDCI